MIAGTNGAAQGSIRHRINQKAMACRDGHLWRASAAQAIHDACVAYFNDEYGLCLQHLDHMDH
jgi:hypothetical protein